MATDRSEACVMVILISSHLYTAFARRISACNDESFASLLCEPGQAISVTRVLVSNDLDVHQCPGENHRCTEPLHPQHQYYKDITDACNGQITCPVFGQSYPISCLRQKSHMSEYTTIEYQCRPVDHAQDIKFSSKCVGHPFTDVECPDDSVVKVVDIFVGIRRWACPRHSYNIANDCLRTLDSVSPLDAVDLEARCESQRGCTTDTSQRYQVARNSQCWKSGSYVTDYTLILYRCQTLRQVLRCHGEKFDSVLCHPGTVINIIRVSASNKRNKGGCSSVYWGQTKPVPGDYYKQVKSACNGKLACVNLTSTKVALESFWTWQDPLTHIKIDYECVNLLHTESYTHRNVGEAFDSVMCSPGSVIDLQKLLVSATLPPPHTGLSGLCSAHIPPHEGYFVDTKKACDGKLACVGVKSKQYNITCGQKHILSTNMTIAFHCVKEDAKDIRYGHHCNGSRFSDVTCPHGYQLHVVNILVGKLRQDSSQCVSGHYNTEDCLLTLNSVSGEDYNRLRDSCQTGDCTEQLATSYRTTGCSEDRSVASTDYTLIAYTCKRDPRYISCCGRLSFSGVACPREQYVRTINVFVGQQDDTSQCTDGQPLTTVNPPACLVTLDSVSHDYWNIVHSCESRSGCTDQVFTPEIYPTRCQITDYMLYVFKCYPVLHRAESCCGSPVAASCPVGYMIHVQSAFYVRFGRGENRSPCEPESVTNRDYSYLKQSYIAMIRDHCEDSQSCVGLTADCSGSNLLPTDSVVIRFYCVPGKASSEPTTDQYTEHFTSFTSSTGSQPVTLQSSSDTQEGSMPIGIIFAVPLSVLGIGLIIRVTVCMVKRRKANNRRPSNVSTDLQMDSVQQLVDQPLYNMAQPVYHLSTGTEGALYHEVQKPGSGVSDDAELYYNVATSCDNTQRPGNGGDVYSSVDKSRAIPISKDETQTPQNGGEVYSVVNKSRDTNHTSEQPVSVEDRREAEESEDTTLFDNSLYGKY